MDEGLKFAKFIFHYGFILTVQHFENLEVPTTFIFHYGFILTGDEAADLKLQIHLYSTMVLF